MTRIRGIKEGEGWDWKEEAKKTQMAVVEGSFNRRIHVFVEGRYIWIEYK